MINWIKELFKPTKRRSLEEIYLSQATSLEEVERRQQQITRGEAPWNTVKMF